jgi:hypothetical protein
MESWTIWFMRKFDINGWKAVYFGPDEEGRIVEVEHRSEATRWEQWVVGGDSYFYTGRPDTDSDWEGVIFEGGLCPHGMVFEGDLFYIPELLADVIPWSGVDPEDEEITYELHPVLLKAKADYEKLIAEVPNTPLRAAFCGASGTGKTTLAKMVMEEFGLELTPIGSRSVAKELGFKSPYDVDKASRESYETFIGLGEQATEAAWLSMDAYDENRGKCTTMRAPFQQMLQSAKIAWEINAKQGFVTDRTPLDDMAYAVMHCREVVDNDFYTRAISSVGDLYDLVIYCPVNAFLNTDGDPARVEDTTYHYIYDAILWGFLRQTADDGEQYVRVLQLAEANLDQRKRLVLGVLHSIRRQKTIERLGLYD